MGIKKELAEMRKAMEKMTQELHETNIAIREALKLTSDTIKEMSQNFSNTLENTLKIMQDMKFQMDIRDTLIKSLGLEGVIPEFLKRKK